MPTLKLVMKRLSPDVSSKVMGLTCKTSEEEHYGKSLLQTVLLLMVAQLHASTQKLKQQDKQCMLLGMTTRLIMIGTQFMELMNKS